MPPPVLMTSVLQHTWRRRFSFKGYAWMVANCLSTAMYVLSMAKKTKTMKLSSAPGACVPACLRACVRACLRACVRACVQG